MGAVPAARGSSLVYFIGRSKGASMVRNMAGEEFVLDGFVEYEP